MAYIKFSEDDLYRANNADLVSYLGGRGERVKRVGSTYVYIYSDGGGTHDSVTIHDGKWYDHKNQHGGYAVKFLQEFLGFSFQDAVLELLGGHCSAQTVSSPKTTSKSIDKPFKLPEPNSDMLSFITLYRKEWKQHSYIAMNGVYESAVLKALENHSGLKSVYLCTDNDEGGTDAAERLRDILIEKGYMDIFRIAPEQKDWNENLKSRFGVESLPAVPHERRELFLKNVSELNMASINPNRIAANLTAIYNSADYVRLAEFSVAASEHFLKIAGVEFPLDMMKNRLITEYKCYLDKGSVSVKTDRLRSAVNTGLERLRSYSQTSSELKVTARKLYDIADHALRLVTEETLVRRSEQEETSGEVPSDEQQTLQAISF